MTKYHKTKKCQNGMIIWTKRFSEKEFKEILGKDADFLIKFMHFDNHHKAF